MEVGLPIMVTVCDIQMKKSFSCNSFPCRLKAGHLAQHRGRCPVPCGEPASLRLGQEVASPGPPVSPRWKALCLLGVPHRAVPTLCLLWSRKFPEAPVENGHGQARLRGHPVCGRGAQGGRGAPTWRQSRAARSVPVLHSGGARAVEGP